MNPSGLRGLLGAHRVEPPQHGGNVSFPVRCDPDEEMTEGVTHGGIGALDPQPGFDRQLQDASHLLSRGTEVIEPDCGQLVQANRFVPVARPSGRVALELECDGGVGQVLRIELHGRAIRGVRW